jgi:SAM-dependent methyltransferase
LTSDAWTTISSWLTSLSGWLHGIIMKSASQVLGVDYDAIGVEKMRQAGYDVVNADITGDLSLVAKDGPFDVIVAGEIIEHVRAPQSVLDFAPPLLAPGGRLLITTRNPYAVWRVRNGQRGRTWENVDHVVYCFPAGMAEMADRAGLRLVQYGSIDRKAPWLGHSARVWLGAKRRGLVVNAGMISPIDALIRRVRGGPMLGETAVYVFEVRD